MSVVAGVVIPALVARYESTLPWISTTNVYTASHLIVAAALLSAWFVKSVTGATVVLATMGISWAIVLWVPFSLVGEYVSYDDERRQRAQLEQAVATAATTTSAAESQQLIENDDFDAGMILGVHNMYIVFPQFVVAIMAAFIFAATNASGDPSSGVASVLAFGGIMALIASAFSRFIVRVK